MARVKVCRLCGRHNTPGELFCVGADCGTSLADVSAVNTSELDRRAAEAAAPESYGTDGGLEGSQDQPSNIGAPTVREGQVPGPALCVLLFPWGRVPVAGQIGIGREMGFSLVSDRLSEFTPVSRRHAMVRMTQGQWTVQDLGSTNGTYVNGVRLEGGASRAISNGDQLGFSRALQVEVEIAGGAHWE